MTTGSISARFLDWASAKVAAQAGDIPVFDERKKDLGQHIRQAVNSGIGCCAVLRFPSLSRANGGDPDDTQYRCSSEVAVLRNAAFKPELDSLTLAEGLFCSFAGADFDLGDQFPAQVGADGFNTSGEGLKLIHTFTISTLITL